MNLGEMKTFVWRAAGENPSAPYTPSAEVTMFLNERALEVAADTGSLLSYSDTATTAGDDRYPLPEDCLSLKDVQITVGTMRKVLERLPYDRFEERFGMAQSGEPIAFRVEFGATGIVAGSPPGDIWLGPNPAQVYPLRIAYFQRTSKLVDGADDDKSYELLAPFHKAVCYGAALDVVLRLDDSSRIVKFKGLYDDALARANILVGRFDRSEPYAFERAYGCGRAANRRRR